MPKKHLLRQRHQTEVVVAWDDGPGKCSLVDDGTWLSLKDEKDLLKWAV